MDFLFHFSALLVTPFWLAMILFPKAGLTQKMVASPWIILPPIACYLIVLLPNFTAGLLIFKNPSPANLALTMGETWGATLFWAYAGAFDLFVGRCIFFDAKERGITHLLIAPILFICILFGPLAFAIYALVRAGKHIQKRKEN